MLDEQQPLGIAVGMQYVGARTVTWDLWGADIDEAFADLRKAAVGGEEDMLFGGGGPSGRGSGWTALPSLERAEGRHLRRRRHPRRQ